MWYRKVSFTRLVWLSKSLKQTKLRPHTCSTAGYTEDQSPAAFFLSICVPRESLQLDQGLGYTTVNPTVPCRLKAHL